ncbi:MAG: hypothetical protein P8Z42_11470, partial [Anaerolineales bacterium]
MPPGERELARMLLECSSGWRSRILEFVLPEYITDSRVRRLLEDSRTIVKDESSKTDFVSVLLERCSDPGLKILVAELCTSPMPEITDESIRVQMQTLLLHQAREGSRRLEPLI